MSREGRTGGRKDEEKAMAWEYMVLEERAEREQLDALGAEGWELVAVVSPAHFVFHYFFKRQARG